MNEFSNLDWYDLRHDVRRWITNKLIRAIRKINPHKDEGLSWELHRTADHYARHPEGKWE